MKTIIVNISYLEIHHQVCNLCAAYDWLQQVNPATGDRYPLITKDMLPLMLADYKRMKDNAVSILRGWITGIINDSDMGCDISLHVAPRVNAHDVETLLESYLIDAMLRKYSHLGKKTTGNGNADETLYLLASMLTPEDDELYDCDY